MIFRRRDNDGFSESSVWQRLTSPFRTVVRLIAQFFERDDSLHVDRSLFLRFLDLLTFPLRLLWGFLVFMVQSWAQSRSGYAFLGGTLAIFGLVFFFGALLTADLFFSEAKRIGSTSGYLAYHVVNSPEFPESAKLFAEKLVELKSDDPEHIFQLALAYERMDEMFKANDAMSFIAFDERPGFPLAHVWRSKYYLRSPLVELDPETREELARKHLGFAVEVAPENLSANFDLAFLYLTQAERLEKGSEEYNAVLELAVEKLILVADGGLTGFHLRAVPRLADLEMELGRERLAKRRLSNEITMLANVARRNPEVFEIWLTMAKCAILLKDYSQASQIINEGLRSVDELETKRRLFQLAAEIYIEKTNDFNDMSNRDQYRDRLNALCDAMRLTQTNRAIYLRLLDFIAAKSPAEINGSQVNSKDQSPNARLDFSKASELWLADSIIGSPTPGVIHCLLGMREISKGNVREGEKHWRMADRQFDRTQIVINNLIDVAAKERPNEFSNMLDMITLGIELFPDQAVFYQTRGVYLMNQDKLDDALNDLLYASEQLPNMISLHKYLIQCYKKLGDEEKVLEQERLIQEKLSSLSSSDRLRVEAAIGRID